MNVNIASSSSSSRLKLLHFLWTSNSIINCSTDRSNAVHSVTLNGGMKKQCENLKKSEVEKIGLEGGMASTENPPSGVITSSTKFDSDSDQTLLPQKKFLYSESNSVVAV